MKKLFTLIALTSTVIVSASVTQPYQQRTAPIFQPSEQNQKALAYNYTKPQQQYLSYYQNDPGPNYNTPQNQGYLGDYQQRYVDPQPNSPYYHNNPQPAKPVTLNQEAVKSQHDTAKTDADKKINAEIRGKIANWVPNSLEAIIIKTDNGSVTIIGAVDNYDDVKKLSDQIRRVGGVQSINNQVIVRNK